MHLDLVPTPTASRGAAAGSAPADGVASPADGTFGQLLAALTADVPTTAPVAPAVESDQVVEDDEVADMVATSDGSTDDGADGGLSAAGGETTVGANLPAVASARAHEVEGRIAAVRGAPEGHPGRLGSELGQREASPGTTVAPPAAEASVDPVAVVDGAVAAPTTPDTELPATVVVDPTTGDDVPAPVPTGPQVGSSTDGVSLVGLSADDLPTVDGVRDVPAVRPVVDGDELQVRVADVAAPRAATVDAAPASPTPRTSEPSAALVDRVLRAVQALESAPPPRVVRLEVEGMHLTIRLTDTGVDVDGAGLLPPQWRADVDRALGARGFVSTTHSPTGDAGSASDGGGQGRSEARTGGEPGDHPGGRGDRRPSQHTPGSTAAPRTPGITDRPAARGLSL